ncbi:MAG: AtpZ/AtpI family protein [Mesorhizobium sp.]
MAAHKGPDETGQDRTGDNDANPRGDDLDRRRRDLEAAIAARRPRQEQEGPGSRTSGMTGVGYALRLSSEFIAGVVVGAGLGWFLDRLAGTSPWGLIVLLLLGFGAGVLNVLRSAGLVAEHKVRKPDGSGPGQK